MVKNMKKSNVTTNSFITERRDSTMKQRKKTVVNKSRLIAIMLIFALVVMLSPVMPESVEVKAATNTETYAILPDGDYYIQTPYGLNLDVERASSDPNANIIIYDAHGASNQVVTITRQPDDSYILSFKYCNKSIDAENYDVFGNLQTYYTHGDTCQRWRFKANGDGTYTIFSVMYESNLDTVNHTVTFGGYCIDIENKASSTPGANVHMWSVHYDHNQRFKMISASPKPPTIEEAINIVVERLNGKYLTANGKSCTGRTGHTACKNCEVHNILAAQWLHDLFPEITNWDKANFQLSGSAWTCYGSGHLLVWLAQELLYGGNVKLGFKKTASCTFTKSNVLKYASVGDHIRLNSSHSVILLGVNSDNTIRVVDVNSGRNGKDNRVEVYNRKIKNVNMKVYKVYVK